MTYNSLGLAYFLKPKKTFLISLAKAILFNTPSIMTGIKDKGRTAKPIIKSTQKDDKQMVLRPGIPFCRSKVWQNVSALLLTCIKLPFVIKTF